MHATIRHYVPGDATAEVSVRAWRDLATALGTEAGFISCAVMATGNGGFAAIAFFDDAASLARADPHFEGFLAQPGAGPGWILVQHNNGEVVAQRGL
jgi:hypothetical protein